MKYFSPIFYMSIKTIYRIEWTGHTMPFACSREGGEKRSLQGEISRALLLKGVYVKYHSPAIWAGEERMGL